MKKLAIAIAAVALIGTPAFAADIAVKAAAPSPAAVYSWTGWYAGVNAGASFGNVKTDFNIAPAFIAVDQITPVFAFSDRTYPSGFMGGGQIGYNWQISRIWVVGLEADFQGALERDTNNNLSAQFTFANNPDPSAVTGACIGCTVAANYTTQIDWFGTARVRIGYAWGDGEVMSYFTGGLAYGKVKINGTNTLSGIALALNLPEGNVLDRFFLTQAFDHSQVNTGWVVGYGTEGVIDFWGSRDWTWKIEGLYMDLGTLDTTGVTTGASFSIPALCRFCTPTGGQVATHSHFTDGILRAGLNYQFH